MRITADANILVRVMVQDDPQQALVARRLLETAEVVALSTVVVCEVAWVLKRSYRFTASEIHAALSSLMHLARVEAEWSVLQAGLDHLKLGGGFADGCILEMARAAGRPLATFDKKLVQLGNGRALDAERLVDAL